MATKNVYITDGLKAEMDALELNWSQIATTAFQTAIELERIKKVDMTAASKARLRQSRDSATDKRHAEGVRKGKEWATERAEYDELDRVSDLASVDFESADEATHALAKVWADTAPEDRLDLREVEHCLQLMFRSTSPTLPEIEGFLEGAAEIFDSIDED
jgi:hypothetical protein